MPSRTINNIISKRPNFTTSGPLFRQPIFISIINRLNNELTATDLASMFPMTRQGVSKYLRILSDANLVQVRQQGRDKLYKLTPEQLKEATTWIAQIQTQWERRLQSLATYLDTTNMDITKEG